MNLFYANGTPIINSLKVTSEVPLDPRLTVENIAERDSLVTNHISYDRMKVYVKSNDTKYIYHKDTGEWEIDNKFSEEDKSKLDRIDNYLIDTEYIYNPENKLLYREHSYDPNTNITTLRDHILQEARVSENGELYNGLLSKFYVNRLNNITNYLIDVSFTKGTDVPNLYLTTHSYNPDEDKTTLTNIDIPLATDDNHGLLSNLQNIKVNRIVDYVNRIDTTHTNAPDTGLTYNYNIYNPFTNANVTKTILIPLVTHTENGLTSSSDKIKIDDIETYVKSIALRQASGTEELGIDYIITNPNDQTDTPGYFNIPLVTDSRNGLVSPARKHWMDNASGVSNTGTASDTWQLDKKDINTRLDPNGGVIIKDSGGIAEIRNNTDSAYSDLTLNNITIKGDVTLEGKSFITEAETVEVRDNTLLLNRGETGAGVSKEFAGIEIDRGSEPKYQILFDESDDRFKVGREGDLWCVTLRDDEADMVNGMFTTWDSSTKRLKTTNIVPSDQKLSFGDNGDIELKYSLSKMGEIFSSAIPILNIGRKSSGYPHIEFGLSSSYAVVYTDALNGIYLQNQVLGRTFKRATDLSEVLYHADIINDLTTGGTNKVLSAEQGKLLQNSITSIQGSYLPLSGGAMTGPILVSYGWDIRTNDGNGILKVISDKSTEIGNLIGETRIRSNSNDLLHMKKDASYKIWDAYNLPDPVTLSGNNTFTGNNTFQAGKFNVGSFKVTSSGSLLLDIDSQGMLAWSRNIMFRANSDNTSSSRFGGYNSTDNTSIGYAYIGIGDVDHSTAQYKFRPTLLTVPIAWSLEDPNGNALVWSQSSALVHLGRALGTTKIRSGNTDLIHTKGSTEYIIWDKSNLPTPATSTDLANYLPLIGGTLTGQLTIKQSVDIKLRLQSTDADNHCIIQAINAQASQLGVFGYAGDKWAIGHNGTYYEIWDKYNLTNPVTYTTNTYNHATLTNKNGQYFTYIKAGTNGLLPHSKATLVSGGSGSLGTSDQSFNAAYINNLHTNKVTFGDAGSFIDNQSGDSSYIGIGFYTSQNAACPVYVGNLYVSDSYANSAPNIPTNGIYSKGVIKSAAGFTSNFRQTNLNLAKTGNDVLYISSFVNGATGAPGSDSNTGRAIDDGMFLTYFWQNDHAFQLAADIDGTGIAYRHYIPSTGNSSTGWKFLADTNWVVSKINSSTSNFLKKTGDTATGQIILDSNGIAFKANTWTNDLAPNRNYSGYLQVLDAYYDASSAGGPTNYGTVLQVNSRNAHWANQLWFPGGAEASKKGLYYRHMPYNSTTYGEWIKLATTSDLGNYLPLSGGTLSGNLTINTVGSTTLVINNNDTNGSETFMRVLRKGTASAAIGFRDSLGAYIYNYNSNKYLFIDNDGYARVGTTSGSTRLALITDIPTVSGYLPLTGGTLTGTLSINSGGSEPLIINNSASAGEAYVVTKTQGTTRGVMGWNSSLGMFLQDSRGYTFSVKADGVYFGASSSTLTKLPTSTDLSGYLPLAGGTMSGNISFNGGTGHIVVGARETSNYVRAVSFNKGSATNSAYIGYHSTGGSDSSGALILVPYSTSADPWAKTVGLYIAKNELLLDGKAIATQEYVNNRSVSWSNITGKPSTYTPSAHSHNSLQIEDNRDVTMLPNNMGRTTLRTFFNANKMPTSDWYSGIHISGWVTNYAAWQLCGPSSNNTTTASSLYFRSGKDSTWNSWKKIAFTSDIPTNTSHLTNDSGFITSSALNGYATQSWANGQFAPLKNYFVTSNYASIATTGNEMCIGSLTSGNSIINVNYRNGTGTTSPSTWYWRAGSSTSWANAYWGNLYMNNNLVATQSWSNSQYPLKTGTGASGTWGISITGNAATATTATKWNGYSIWTGTEDELPSSRDANTLYFVKKSS